MDEKIVLNLMQNVSDKLDDISSNLKELNQTSLHNNKSESNEEYLTAIIREIYSTQQEMSLNIIREQKRQIKNIEETIDNTKQFIVFGKDTSIISKGVLLIILLLLIFSNSIKHVPNYLNERSQIKKEREDYKQVYDFLLLYHYDDKDGYDKTLSDLLKHSKSKKPAFINKLKSLRKKHNKDLKIKKVKNHLKELEK